MQSTIYYKQLDGIRFIAVALVLIDHWLAERSVLPLGPLGVTLFFVLSGFLITKILISSKEKDLKLGRSHLFSYKQFYTRRSIRIFPLYYLALFLLIIFKSPTINGKILWHFFYASNIYIVLKHTWLGISDHFWSLAVEEQFYVFFPLLLFITPMPRLKTLFWAMILISIILRFWLFFNNSDWTIQYVSTITCLDSFGIGAILAHIVYFSKEETLFKSSKSYFLLFSTLAVIFLIIGEILLPPKRDILTDVFERLVFSIFSMALIYNSLIGFTGFIKSFLEHQITVYLGKISYGIYIFHNFIYNYYHTTSDNILQKIIHKIQHKLPFLDNLIFELATYFICTVLVASLCWELLEKPINKLKEKFAY